MKTMKLFFFLILTLVLFSCGGQNNENNKNDNDTLLNVETPTKTEILTDSLTGEYRGEFGSTTIFFSLSYINLDNGSASGFNIVRGNRRNIKGSVEEKEGVLFFKLSEPGDDKYDGVFDFTLYPKTRQIEGTWTPNDEKKAQARTLKLKKAKPLGPDDVIEGDWFLSYEEKKGNDILNYCNGQITFKKDGTCTLNLNKWDETIDTSITDELKGSWVKEKDMITIDIQKSKILKKQKYVVKYKVESEEFGYGYYYGDNLTISNSWY